MFIEDIIKGKANKITDVKVEGFEDTFRVTELSVKDTKVIQAKTYKGFDKVKISELAEGEMDFVVDIAEFSLNQTDANAYLVGKAFEYKKGNRYEKFNKDLLDNLTDEQLNEFVKTYNELFQLQKD